MVSSNTGPNANSDLPIPPNPNPNEALETDSDGEEAYEGYQPLRSPELDDNASEDTEDVSEEEVSSSLPPIISVEEEVIQEVWGKARASAVDIVMDKEKVEEVKEVMSGITLPPSCIPEWAMHMSEAQLDFELQERLKQISQYK